MEKKTKLDAPLWVRVSKKNLAFIDKCCKQLKRSRSDVVEKIITEFCTFAKKANTDNVSKTK